MQPTIDKHGNRCAFRVYDSKRRTHDGRPWQVATYRYEANAQLHLAEAGRPALYVSCVVERAEDKALYRD